MAKQKKYKRRIKNDLEKNFSFLAYSIANNSYKERKLPKFAISIFFLLITLIISTTIEIFFTKEIIVRETTTGLSEQEMNIPKSQRAIVSPTIKDSLDNYVQPLLRGSISPNNAHSNRVWSDARIQSWVISYFNNSLNIKVDNSETSKLENLIDNNFIRRIETPIISSSNKLGNSENEYINLIIGNSDSNISERFFIASPAGLSAIEGKEVKVNFINSHDFSKSISINLGSFHSDDITILDVKSFLPKLEAQLKRFFLQKEKGKQAKILLLTDTCFKKLNYSQFDNIKELIPEIADLKLSDFGEFYLFDHFENSSNTHGEKVLDVVRQILNENNLDFALQKVIPVPINYYENIEKGDSLYYEYLKGIPDTIEAFACKKKFQVIDSLSLNKLTKEAINDSTPSNYLTAIYSLAIDKKADIISSSYLGSSVAAYLYEPLLSSYDTLTNYFSASTNDSFDIDNYTFSTRIETGKGRFETIIIEPLSSYMDKYTKKGIIIVGNQIQPDKYINMYSSSGRFVTALGKGNGWGVPNVTKVITDSDIGASFATPEVAAKLFIAKAYWRAKGENVINSIEARNRLILSTNLNKNFVQKFASAGSVNLKKLLQIDAGYLVDSSDNIIPLEKIYRGYISFRKAQKGLSVASAFEISQNFFRIDDVRGLYISDKSIYTVRNETNGNVSPWEYTGEMPYDLFINARVKDELKDIQIYLDDFLLGKYKQFVILK